MVSFQKRTVRILVPALVIFGFVCMGIPVSTVSAVETGFSPLTEKSTSVSSGYRIYREQYTDAATPDCTIVLDAENYIGSDEVAEGYQESRGKTVLTTDESVAAWSMVIPETGLYHIVVEYYPTPGTGGTIERSLSIDGNVPFSEAGRLSFMRTYVNEENKDEPEQAAITKDQTRPKQVESARWMTAPLVDSMGLVAGPLQFFLEAGEHTLTLESVREPMAIRTITLCQLAQADTYEETLQKYENVPISQDVLMIVEGEDAVYKSDATLAPVSDRTTASTSPNHPQYIVYNAIGGKQYASAGQWLEWVVNIETEGLYCISIKARQNINSGLISSRRLTIDGELPFSEAENIAFPYDTRWSLTQLGDGEEPYLFYLEPGKHTLRLEVVIGEMGPILSETNELITDLNNIYRSIMMVTGAQPDTNRDYDFNKTMPEVLEALAVQKDRLKMLYEEIQALSNQNGENAQIFNKLYEQAKLMTDDHRRIASLLTSFRDNIATLGTWYTNAMQQPLQIDYLIIHSPEQILPKATAGFISELVFTLKQFFYTFGEDYGGDVKAEAEDAVTVWMGNNLSGGRDQAQVLKQLIKNDFELETGIPVQLELIPTGSLLQATMAGAGPDVALTLSSSEPINYAVRHAAQDLSGFSGFDEVVSRFHSSAMTSLSFMGGVYGLPETTSWYMMFYRTDIMEELNLDIPQTWDDVFNMLPVLQEKQMNFAMPAPVSDAAIGAGLYPFLMLLYQNGGQLYEQDGRFALLDSEAAVETFTNWSKMYTEYELPTNYDFPNRFRTGEFPIGITDFSMYNWINVFAPDLTGRWSIAPIPGVLQEDGTINRAVPVLENVCMMLEASNNKENAWKFMEWWSRADVQTAYNLELESILGTTGRLAVSNLEAMAQIPWGKTDYENLMEQLEWAFGVPEVPGSYFSSRHIDFAIKKVINQEYDPFDALIDANETINVELAARRRDFGLD